jgi:MoaA/NifB/PqqE/SkfB family radical SAM enzyme
MQFYNLARIGMRTLAHNLVGTKCPVNVMLAVTNRCNATCSYCQSPQPSPEDIPLDRMLGLVDEMAAAGTVRLGLCGGEPLMLEGIGDLVRHAKKCGMDVTMHTNGLRWRECHHELAGLDQVTFALDGDLLAHEANRGEGTYDTVKDALKLASETPDLAVWTQTVITKNNLYSIDSVIDTAEELGIHCAFQILHQHDVMGANHDHLMLSNAEYRAVIDYLRVRKRDGAPIASSMRYLKYLRSWPDYRKSVSPEKHLGMGCKAGAMSCNVDADGKVYACSRRGDTSSAQNALDVGFKQAFDAIPPLACQGCSSACLWESCSPTLIMYSVREGERWNRY